MLPVFSRCSNPSQRVPVNDQQSQTENGCELGNTENNRRQRGPLEMNSAGNRSVIKPGVQTAQGGVSRHSLSPVLELNNNRVQDKEDSPNPTGEGTLTSGSQLNGHTVPRRSTEAGDGLSPGFPETVRSVKAWSLRNIQQQAKRMYQGIRNWVVMLFLYLAGPVPTRQKWNSTSDSIMGLLAVTVGLGNFWRFPYFCYKHKGVHFIIAYVITLLAIGFPLLMVDISVGQYLSLGPTNAYASMAPLFSGLGWAMVLSSTLISIYYAVILGWSITYIQHSFRKDFIFAPNDTASGPEDYHQKAKDFFRFAPFYMGSLFTSPSSIFHCPVYPDFLKMKWYLYLNDAKNFEIHPQLVLSLGLTWLFVMVILVRGIRSSSKVLYFTNTFPIAVMLLLLLYSYLSYDQKVWNKSFELYVSPTQVKGTELLSWEIWADAASQVLFTLGHLFGGPISLASYNDLRQNTLWTALLTVLWDTASSFLSGCLVFISLSKLTSDLNVDIEALFNANHTVGNMGVEVVFRAYPAFLAVVETPIWFTLFFLMILTLGIDSLIGLVETVTTALFDNFTSLRNCYFPNVCVVTLVIFVLGLPMCTSTGFYTVECMHIYTCNLSLPLLGISYIVLVCYVFGFDNLMRIIRLELAVTVPKFIEWYLRLALKYISPVVYFGLVISAVRHSEFPILEGHTLPSLYTPLGWILSISPFLLVLAFAIYKCIQLKDKDWHLLLRPTQDFLPAYLREHSNRPDMYILADY